VAGLAKADFVCGFVLRFTGSISFMPAMFGPMPNAGGLNGTVVAVEPFDACSPLGNTTLSGIPLKGRIALIYANGNCMIGSKVYFAQQQGCIGACYCTKA
jgi:hypothetical protein